jgi:hypothetical protein
MRKNAIICSTMQAGEECNPMKCNENVENASECMSMHLNAYGKKQHHFREKTTLIPCLAPVVAELLARTHHHLSSSRGVAPPLELVKRDPRSVLTVP